jgi:outer membrane protein assembly factor BamB
MKASGARGLHWSRRQFMALGAGVAGSAVLAACGAPTPESTTAVPITSRYYSRPDLEPPRIDVSRPGPLRQSGYFFLSPGGPLMVDDTGQPIWIHPVADSCTNFKVQTYQGQPVLTWWQGEVASYGVGQSGQCPIMDSSYNVIETVVAGNGLQADLHEFILTQEGTAYLTAYQEVRRDLTVVNGPKHGTMLDAIVQEVDVASGAVLFEWHSADHINLKESYRTYSKAPYDPVHINSIEQTDDGHLLFSARHTWTIYKVNRATGALMWRLGGKNGDFSLGPGVRFAWQHDARQHPGGVISLFDDEASPAEAEQSRALFLHADEATMRASLLREYRHPGKRLLAGSQGSVQLLANDDVVVGWGALPYYTQFRRDGTLVTDAMLRKGHSYRAFRYPCSGRPTDGPAIVIKRKAPGKLAVYASWNGATDVEHWNVLAGSNASTLMSVANAPRMGFETEIALGTAAPYVAVQAIDAVGAILGTSLPREI